MGKLELWEDPLLRTLEAELAQPFLNEQISWRVGSTNREKTQGMALAYIDARDVMERLDGIMGVAGWQDRYSNSGNGKTCCEVGLFLNEQWVWKSDGAGDTGFEADKGAFSDAFKRAAVRWGIGRYLYGMKNTWVAIEPAGKSFKIAKGEREKLDGAHKKHAAGVGMSSPAERAAIKALAQSIRSTCMTADDVDEWTRNNGSMVQQLRAAQQQHIHSVLDAIKRGVSV